MAAKSLNSPLAISSLSAEGRVKNVVMITDELSDVRIKYKIHPRPIGHGHYGVVRKCMLRETNEWFAIKSIRKIKVGNFEALRREVEILKQLDHPNIIKLIDVHEDEDFLHLITELCFGGELFDQIISKTQSPAGKFSERDAVKLITFILDAIRYCHAKNIVHRDLKPENFIFATAEEGSQIKMIDFGLSRFDTTSNHNVMKTRVGTPYYIAPEVLKGDYTRSCDMWSIGVIAYILLCGCPPFNGDTDEQVFKRVKSGVFSFNAPEWDGVSYAAKDFICCLLRMDPRERLMASEALAHPWIAGSSSKRMSRLHSSWSAQHSTVTVPDTSRAICQQAWSTLATLIR
jgi:calcium-dependent protein kinase